jgi:hypothetical protein
MIALGLDIYRVLRVFGSVFVDHRIGLVVGSAPGIQDREIVKWLLRLGEVVYFLAPLFALPATYTAGGIKNNAHLLWISGKVVLGSGRDPVRPGRGPHGGQAEKTQKFSSVHIPTPRLYLMSLMIRSLFCSWHEEQSVLAGSVIFIWSWQSMHIWW